MFSNLPYRECRVYPGDYTPLPETESLMGQLKSEAAAFFAKPFMNMDEYNDHFTIDIQLPGAKREDIAVHIEDNILFITMLHKTCEVHEKNLQLHEFENSYFERHISLPDNADTAFISAAFNSGILSFYIPKTQEYSKTGISRVVVY